MDKIRLSIRKANLEDLLLIFEWANDPYTRSMSFSQEEILLEHHKVWFEKVLKEVNRHILIVEKLEADGMKTPLGQVRFEDKHYVGISVAEAFRGKKLGQVILEKGIDYGYRELGVELFIAHIRPENMASRKIFERAGFVYQRETQVKGVFCYEFHLNKKASTE